MRKRDWRTVAILVLSGLLIGAIPDLLLVGVPKFVQYILWGLAFILLAIGLVVGLTMPNRYTSRPRRPRVIRRND